MFNLELIFSTFSFILGLTVGSFLNVVILRGIKGKKLTGRDYCPRCNHVLGFWDLIPVFSFLFLKGRCRYCHRPISLQYPLVELSTAALFAYGAYWLNLAVPFSLSPIIYLLSLLFLLILTSVLIVVFVTDLRWGLVPVNYVWWSLAGAFAYRLSLHIGETPGDLSQIAISTVLDLASGLTVGAAFWVLYKATRGRGIGEGDIPLGFLMGILVGWPNFWIALFLSFVIGAAISLLLIALGLKKITSTVPFGPFIIVSVFLASFWGQAIQNWYLGLLGLH